MHARNTFLVRKTMTIWFTHLVDGTAEIFRCVVSFWSLMERSAGAKADLSSTIFFCSPVSDSFLPYPLNHLPCAACLGSSRPVVEKQTQGLDREAFSG